MQITSGRCLAVFIAALQLNLGYAQSNVTPFTGSSSTPTITNRGCGTPTLPAQFENWLQNLPQVQPKKTGGGQTQSVFNIPVIVHVVHNNQAVNNATATSGANLNSAQIYNQINILNRDFNGLNADTSLIPSVFKPLAGKFQFNFCLAVVNPTGGILAEPGINRINRTTKGWTAPPYSSSYVNGTIKPNSIWDPTRYLNMWVLDLGGTLLGFATFPNPGSSGITGLGPPYGSLTTDGVVMDNQAFGSIGTAVNNAPYHLGRTTVHEVGHWLGLRHIWGDNTCATDYCADTPPAQQENYGCKSHPFNSGACPGNTTGEMFMNYMDYSNDACMYMFTKDQKYRAQLIMTHSALRAGLLTSTVCNLPTTNNEIGIQYVLSPTYSQVINCNNVITPSIVIHNYGANIVTSATYSYNMNGIGTQTVPWTGTLMPGTSATIALPPVSNLPNGSHQYNVGVYLPNGSADTYTTNNYNSQQFSIVNSFTLSVSGGTASCSGAPVTLTAQAPVSGFTWQPGGASGPTVIVTPTVTTVYTVNASNGICVNSKTIAITPLVSPTVNINSPTICSGMPAVLAPGAGACSYTWLPGNVNTPSLTVTPATTTNYTLIAQGCNGCSVTRVATVTVNQTPTISIATAPSGSLCAGGSATLSANGASSYSWSTGSSSPAIVVSPAVNTTYTVTGTAAGCTASTTAMVTVGSNALNILITPNPATVCAGSPLNLTATGATSYTWSTGDNNSVVVVTPTANTSYTVDGNNGVCTASAVVNVAVQPAPQLSLTVLPSPSVCAGTNVTVTASGATSYVWSNTATGPTMTANISTPVTFSVVGDANGCTTMETVSISVSGSALGIVPAASPASVCSGGSVTLSAVGIPSFTWTGAPGGGNFIVHPGQTTTYTLTGSDGPCTASATIEVTVIPAPALLLSGHNTSVCPGKNAVVVVSGPYNTFNWMPGGTTGSTLVTAPASTTSYTVAGMGSPNGCSTSSVFTIPVLPAPSVVLTTSNTPCNEPCEGFVNATASGGLAPYTFSLAGTPCTSMPCLNLCEALYTLYTTDAAGCESLTFFSIECYVKESVGERSAHNISVFPNPVRNELTVHVNGSFVWTLYNELGQAVYAEKETTDETVIETGNLQAGVYFLMIRKENTITHLKVLKEN